MKPCKDNFCGGNFKDWLEVMLLPECNGTCSWCIEKSGFHPVTRVSYRTLASVAIHSGKQNIILLGGEPTLYKNLRSLINELRSAERNVYVTTNGSRLTEEYAPQLKT